MECANRLALGRFWVQDQRMRLMLSTALCVLGLSFAALGDTRVKLLRTPEGGIQPQVIRDSRGVVHLIYYRGEAAQGDIFYVRQSRGSRSFPNRCG